MNDERIPFRTRLRHDDGDAAATLCQPATSRRREESSHGSDSLSRVENLVTGLGAALAK